MISDLIGVKNNRLSLQKDQKTEEYVLKSQSDDFFDQVCLSSFGDVGVAVHELISKFSEDTTSARNNLKDLNDLQNYVENLPEIKAQKYNMGKHVSIVATLARIVEEQNLLDIGEVEQSFLINDRHSQQKLIDLIQTPTLSLHHRLRLMMMLAVKNPDFNLHLTDPNLMQNYQTIKNFVSKRKLNLFANQNILIKARSAVKRHVKGVSNVYAQYQPAILSNLIDQIKNKGGLKEHLWQYVTRESSGVKVDQRLLIVFIVGGATVSEASFVEEFNQQSNNLKLLLLSTNVLTSTDFIDSIVNERSTAGRITQGALSKISTFISDNF
ncbi:hypothetical protein GEMRC1_010434 [Eukaryota sp. GEM-RC1]